jgi:hypothetical protein
VLSREDFEGWLENPATRAVLKAIGNRANFTREMVQGQMMVTAYLTPEHQVQLALLKGEAMAYELMSMLTFEDLQQREKDESGL